MITDAVKFEDKEDIFLDLSLIPLETQKALLENLIKVAMASKNVEKRRSPVLITLALDSLALLGADAEILIKGLRFRNAGKSARAHFTQRGDLRKLQKKIISKKMILKR